MSATAAPSISGTDRSAELARCMLLDLRQRVPEVSLLHRDGGYVCVLAGAGWRVPYRGSTAYAAIDAAHASYYWPSEP